MSNNFSQHIKFQAEETLWRFQQYDRSLQDYRQDIARQWCDNAAKEINQRYLDPAADERSTTVSSFNSQLQSLSLAEEHITQAEDCHVEINTLREARDRCLDDALQDLEQAQAEYDVYQENYLAVEDKLLEINRLLALVAECDC